MIKGVDKNEKNTFYYSHIVMLLSIIPISVTTAHASSITEITEIRATCTFWCTRICIGI